MVGEDGLGLEYDVHFDVEKGASAAEKELIDAANRWQKILDGHKLQVNFSAAARPDNNTPVSSGGATANQDAAGTRSRKAQIDQLTEMSAYYKELSERAKNFYNANQSDKSAALEGLSSRLKQIDKEINDIEYNLIGLTDKKKPRHDTTIQLQWIDDLKKEAASIQSAMTALSSLKMGGEVADVSKLNAGITTTNFELLQMKEHYKQVGAEAAKLSKTALSKANTKDVLGMKEGSIDEIEKKIQRLNDSMKIFSTTAGTIGVNDEKLNGAFRRANDELNRLTQKLAALKAGFGNQSLNRLLTINPKSIQEANALMAELSKRREALNRNDSGYMNSISGINKKQAELSAQNSEALRIGISKTRQIEAETTAYHHQAGVIDDLRHKAARYLSIYAAGNLIKHIAETTGEFELQEKSLSAILQSADRASEIIGQIKPLALISPFQFKDLVSYTKQLAAYRIETDTLYDTMKNLADVSAGLGVDMSRIILAYGQVSAASVLRGQELRQFTEAGIPLVSLLADKFTELEGRVVSTGEVFGKISNRLVSFEMVKDIFSDMSSEGGMFFNMQEIQAETLIGKISNLTDAYHIMFNSMGNSEPLSSIMIGGVDMLVSMAKNWDTVALSITPVIAALGVYKAMTVGVIAVQNMRMAHYGAEAALVEAKILSVDREIAIETKKMGIQSAGMVISRADAAAKAASVAMTAVNISSGQKEVAMLTVKNLVLKAGTNTSKLANLEARISTALQLKGVGVAAADIAAKQAVAAANGVVAASNRGLAQSFKLLFLANPALWIAGIVAAVVAAAAGIYMLWDNSTKLRREISKLAAEGIGKSADMGSRFVALANTVTKSTSSVKEQTEALSSLKQIYGDILPAQLLTIDGLIALKGNYESATIAIQDYIAAKTKEKQIEAINDDNQEKITPVYDKIIKGMVKAGVATQDAKRAAMAFQKEASNGNMVGMSTLEVWGRLRDIVKDISGKDIVTQKTGFWAFDTTMHNAGKLNELLIAQKGAIEELNNTDMSNYYGKFDRGMKSVRQDIDNTVEALVRGEEVIDGKKTAFKESFYEFEERKAAVEKTKLLNYLNSLMDEGKALIDGKRGSVDILSAFSGKSNDLQKKKLTDDLAKQIEGLDLNPFQKRVNEILLANGAGNQDTNSFDSLLITNKNKSKTTAETLDEMKSAWESSSKAIAIANKAINDGVVYNSATMDAFDRNGKRLRVTWQMELDGYTKYINGKAVYVTGLKRLNAAEKAVLDDNGLGEDDKKPKKPAVDINKDLIKSLENRAALMKQAKSEYDKLVKAGQTPEEARKTTEVLFKGQLEPRDISTTDADLSKQLKVIKGRIAAIPKGKEAAFKLGLNINDIDTGIVVDELKVKLKAIQDEFDSSKQRVDVFKDIFTSTGDYNLASRIAESFEGKGTTDIETAIKKALKQSFEGAGINISDLSDEKGNLDYIAAQKAITAMADGDKKTALQKQFEVSKDFKKKEYMELLDGLTNFESYEIKRTKIVMDGEAERAKYRNSGLPQKMIDTKIEASIKKQNEGTSALDLEQFKGSATWAKAFGDLEKVSKPTLDRLKSQLIEFKESAEGRNMPITEIEALTKTIEDLEAKTAKVDLKGLFKVLSTDYKIPELTAKLKTLNESVEMLKKQSITDTTDKAAAQTDLMSAKSNLDADPENVELLKKYNAALLTYDLASAKATVSTNALGKAMKDAAAADKDLTEAENAKSKKFGESVTALSTAVDGLGQVSSAVSGAASAFYSMADAMGLTVSDETRAIIDGIVKGFGAVVAVLSAIVAILVVIEVVAAPLLIISGAILAIIAAIVILNAIKLAPINKELKAQAKIVEELEKQYEELGRKMGDALGSDWLKMYNQELENTNAQIAAISRQVELEKSKGKDSNPEDLKKFEDDLAAKQLVAEEASKKLQQFVSGTDLNSAAKDFATAWLDAYKSFGNTTDAMKTKFKDMLNNMVVNTMLAKAMEIALRPVFDAMEKAAESGSEGGSEYTPNEIAEIVKKTTVATTNTNSSMTAIMEQLKAAGIDMREDSSNLTGLSKGISSVTEDTALLLGGYLDSIRFRLFRYLDLKETIPTFDIGGGLGQILAAQNIQITHLIAISNNTLKTAEACEALVSEIQSLKSPSSSGSGYALRVNL